MNLETQISIFAVVCGVLSMACSLFLLKKTRSQRGLLEFLGKQLEDLDEVHAKNKEISETYAQRFADQSRRIAWLESRIRQPKPPVSEVIDDSPAPEPTKMSITERRHRVMTLASRGQSAEIIAGTLGMMPGEVELIINLNQTVKK